MCFKRKQINKNHDIAHLMIQFTSKDSKFPSLRSSFFLDRMKEYYSKLEYGENEKCYLCSAKLKGLTLNIDENKRVCLDCYKNNSIDSSLIYLENQPFCDICFRIIRDNFFLCETCGSNFAICLKCSNGAENEKHSKNHTIKFKAYNE